MASSIGELQHRGQHVGAVFGDIMVYVQEVNPRRTGRRKDHHQQQGEEGGHEGGKRPLTLKSWSTIKDVKQTLQTLLHVPMNKQRLFFNGRELSSPSSAGISPSASVDPSLSPSSDSSSSSAAVLRRRHTTGESGEGGSEAGRGGGGGGGAGGARGKGLRELDNYGHSLQDCGIIRDGETIYFTIARPPSLDMGHSGPILRPYGLLQPPRRLGRAIKQVRRAMDMGIHGPKLTIEGFGGTYFLFDPRRRPLAVFKPADEEPYAPLNPRGPELVAEWGRVAVAMSPGSEGGGGKGKVEEVFQMRPGVTPGEGYMREVAAYLLDHNGFSGVPETTVVEARHRAFHYPSSSSSAIRASRVGGKNVKVGSFQEFVRHDAVGEDLSPSLFPVREVHKIALLDLRLLNSDRNGEIGRAHV